MRKLLYSTALVGTLVLGSCTTTGQLDPRVSEAIAFIQAGARNACAFLPVAADIASLLTANPELIGQAASVVQILCDALPPATLRRVAPGATISVRVFGTEVRGTRL